MALSAKCLFLSIFTEEGAAKAVNAASQCAYCKYGEEIAVICCLFLMNMMAFPVFMCCDRDFI
jgi:hypothetical protein